MLHKHVLYLSLKHHHVSIKYRKSFVCLCSFVHRQCSEVERRLEVVSGCATVVLLGLTLMNTAQENMGPKNTATAGDAADGEVDLLLCNNKVSSNSSAFSMHYFNTLGLSQYL